MVLCLVVPLSHGEIELPFASPRILSVKLFTNSAATKGHITHLALSGTRKGDFAVSGTTGFGATCFGATCFGATCFGETGFEATTRTELSVVGFGGFSDRGSVVGWESAGLSVPFGLGVVAGVESG